MIPDDQIIATAIEIIEGKIKTEDIPADSNELLSKLKDHMEYHDYLEYCHYSIMEIICPDCDGEIGNSGPLVN